MKIKSESSNPFERLQADFQIKRIQTIMGQKRKEDGKWEENVKRFKVRIIDFLPHCKFCFAFGKYIVSFGENFHNRNIFMPLLIL